MKIINRQVSAAIPIGENIMNKPYYQNFYKLQMAMMEKENDNVLIFGPAASGKCDALERCIAEYGRENKVALLTKKSALFRASYGLDVTCITWSTDDREIKPEWLKDKFDYIIIDGYCTNWEELIKAFPTAKFIMAVRADTKGDLPTDLKQAFRIIAKCGYIDKETKTKGITSVSIFKG
jgi:hypothetical protein